MTLLAGDRALLDAFRRGEGWAIERVYRHHVAQVVALLRRGFSFGSGGQMMQFHGYKDEWELETAVQDTFIQAFSPAAREAYDGLKPFGPYLLTIARNRVISNLRSDAREKRRRDSLRAEGVHERVPTPESAVARAEVRTLVDGFVRELPARLRRYYEARYEGDRTLMDAARELGLSRMQARTHEAKLRKRFLKYLKEKGVLFGPGGAPAGNDLIALALIFIARGW